MGNSQSVIQEWYKSFIENLKKISDKMKSVESQSGNEVYASIGTTPESKELIAELVGELDEEYALRKELEKEKDPDAWFKKKVVETMDDLARNGIIDAPAPSDYENAYRTIQDAMDECIAKEAEQTARELDVETDTLIATEENEFFVKDEEVINPKEGE